MGGSNGVAEREEAFEILLISVRIKPVTGHEHSLQLVELLLIRHEHVLPVPLCGIRICCSITIDEFLLPSTLRGIPHVGDREGRVLLVHEAV